MDREIPRSLSWFMNTLALMLAMTAAAYDPELTNFKYPFPVAYHELTTQRHPLRMAYLDVKPETPNGRTVLLLHGKNFGAYYWEPTIRELTKTGYRVVAPDQIGFGKSSKPAAYQFSFQQLASNTRSLLNALGISRVSVVGHSMGGMLATRFVLQYPEATERLVMVNPIGLEDYRPGVPYLTVDQFYAQELKATPDSIREYERQSYFAGRWKPEYDWLIEALAGWTRHPEYPRVAWNAALTTDMIVTQPVVYEFSDVLYFSYTQSVWSSPGALAPNMVARRAARGRRAGGWGDAAAARGRKGALFFLSAGGVWATASVKAQRRVTSTTASVEISRPRSARKVQPLKKCPSPNVCLPLFGMKDASCAEITSEHGSRATVMIR